MTKFDADRRRFLVESLLRSYFPHLVKCFPFLTFQQVHAFYKRDVSITCAYLVLLQALCGFFIIMPLRYARKLIRKSVSIKNFVNWYFDFVNWYFHCRDICDICYFIGYKLSFIVLLAFNFWIIDHRIDYFDKYLA